MVVNVEHIYKTFANREVLHDISLTLHEGEIVGLLGPNGAGKTTLMKILLGLIPPDKKEGVATVINVPADKGYLSEKNPLYENMYVREYLGFMAELTYEGSRKMRRAMVERLIEAVGMRSEVKKKISELSKGYRQRIGLAQAIMADPALLILDEPTTGLDPNQIIEIRALIRDMVDGERHKPKVIILSTHILQEVQEMCSRVIIIDHGHIKTDQPAGDIDDLEELFKLCTHGGKI